MPNYHEALALPMGGPFHILGIYVKKFNITDFLKD